MKLLRHHLLYFALKLSYAAGAVSGVQSALQSLLQSLSYIPTLVVSELNDFRWLMLASLGMVFVACLVYSLSMTASCRHQGSTEDGAAE